MVTWLNDRFQEILAPPSAERQRDLVGVLASADRTGGAVYDALIALTVKLAGAVLVTADPRALPVYELVGVELRHLTSPT